jgi:predicted AlkP superfamily pyrophosphatase or phosphodiesterase
MCSDVPVRRGVIVGAVVLLGLVGCAQPTVSPKVLLIGIDGVRVDVLADAHTPHIDSLIAAGALASDAEAGRPTVSGPSWSSMLIGVWTDKHGVHGNDFSANRYDQYPDFLTRLEGVDSRFGTYAVVDWPPLATPADGGPLLSGAIDRIDFFDGESLGYRVADSLSVIAAMESLTFADIDAAFVYLGDVDVVGHDTGSLSPEYRAAIERADAQVGRLLDAVVRRRTYVREDWLILVSTDHGRTDTGGHGGDSVQESRIFVLASGPSVRPGPVDGAVGIVDVAVTALHHLGITIDPAWQLDGKVVGLGGTAP